MKKSIQDVIVFLGSSIRFFALYMLINFLILTLLMAFTLVIFHLQIRYLHSFKLFLILVFFSFILIRCLQIWVLFKKHLILQYAFLTYRKNGQAEWHFKNPSQSLKDFIKETKHRLQPLGSGIFSGSLAKIYSVLLLVLNEKGAPTEEKVRTSRQWIVRSFLGQIFVSMILLLPFALVSFLLTVGIDFQLRLVIFIVGLWFVWFLYMALVNPIFRLLLVDKIYQQYQGEE